MRVNETWHNKLRQDQGSRFDKANNLGDRVPPNQLKHQGEVLMPHKDEAIQL